MTETQPHGNPYVGPRAFAAGEAFFGRERELRSLAALLLAERIVLLHSPSGAGKTSLIQAGLIPQLAERLRVLPVMRLNLEPPAEALGIPGQNRYTLSALLSLEEGFAEAERLPISELASLSLTAYLEKRLSAAEQPPNSLLVFDQFEEVLTVSPADREIKAAFFEGLGETLQDRHLWALFSIREDYMGGLAPYARHIPNRLGVSYRLDLLGVEAARQAMQIPARAAGADFSDEAAELLVSDLRRIQVQQPDASFQAEAGLYIEPVQLQVVCYNLWQSGAAEDGRIDAADLERVGNVDQALASYYASTVAAACAKTGADERQVREWFGGRLITPERIRGQVLKGPETTEGLDNRTLGEMEAAHLVRGDTRGGKTWYELAHDRLVEPVLKDNAAWFESHLSVLQKQAALWKQQDRSDGLLLRGRLLDEIEQEATSVRLNPDEYAFLAASLRLRQQERRQQRFVSALAILLAVSVLLGSVALSFSNRSNRNLVEARAANTQAAQNLSAANVASTLSAANAAAAETEAAARGAAEKTAVAESARAVAAQVQAENQANRARAGELAALSLTKLDQDLGLAFLFAAQAYLITDTLQTRQALFESWNYSRALTGYYQGHSHAVSSVAWSPDGRLASASCAEVDGDDRCTKGEIIVWDLDSGQPAQALQGHAGRVNSLAWSPEGQLASGSSDGTVIVWDLESGQPARILTGPTWVTSVAWSPDGRLAYASVNENTYAFTIFVWDSDSNLLTQNQWESIFSIDSLAWSPDGGLAGVGDSGLIFFIKNPGSVQEPQTLYTDWNYGLAWSLDGRLTTASCLEGANFCTKGGIILWDLENDKPDKILELPSSLAESVAWSQDGQLASGLFDGAVVLWDLQSNQPALTLMRHKGPVSAVAWSPDGRLASGSGDGTVIVWDPRRLQSAQTLPKTSGGAWSVAWSPDGRLASGSEDGTVIVWDLERGQPVQTLQGHTSGVDSVAWSPDGRLASAGCSEVKQDDNCTKGEIIVWDLERRQPAQALQEHAGRVNSLAWSPEGQLASGSSDGTVIVWDLESGKPKSKSIPDGNSGVYHLAWSPDGRLAWPSLSDVVVWNPEGEQPEQYLSGHPWDITGVAWSPDGRLASASCAENTPVSCNKGGEIILWDLVSGQPAQILYGHTGQYFTVAWSLDGRLASGASNGTIILWDLENGEPAYTLQGYPSSVDDLAWSLDGRLAAESGDGTIQVWDMKPTTWIDQVCRRAGRNLTRAEWERYLPWKPYEPTCPQWPAGE